MNLLNTYLEQTNLSPFFTDADLYSLVRDALEFQFHGICLPPYWVKKAARELRNSHVAIVTVVGFPLGFQRSETKVKEAQVALLDGATEIDMVMSMTAFKARQYEWVKAEIAQVAKITHDNEALLKVIIETAYLDNNEIVEACKICQAAGADFVKTSTGMANPTPQKPFTGATVEDIILMRETLHTDIGIKASGGIKTYQQAAELIAAGADRIGASACVAIMSETKKV
jgi:deoxyribose-phosphate aldolase